MHSAPIRSALRLDAVYRVILLTDPNNVPRMPARERPLMLAQELPTIDDGQARYFSRNLVVTPNDHGRS